MPKAPKRIYTHPKNNVYAHGNRIFRVVLAGDDHVNLQQIGTMVGDRFYPGLSRGRINHVPTRTLQSAPSFVIQSWLAYLRNQRANTQAGIAHLKGLPTSWGQVHAKDIVTRVTE